MTNISKKQAVNPYLPSWEYVPDAEPRVFGDRVYIYGSHDLFNGADFCLGDYVCWSAPLDNLGDWKYEGVIYKASQDPRNKKGKCICVRLTVFRALTVDIIYIISSIC